MITPGMVQERQEGGDFILPLSVNGGDPVEYGKLPQTSPGMIHDHHRDGAAEAGGGGTSYCL